MKNRTRNDKILWGNLDDLKRGSNARAVKGSYNRRMAAPNMGCFGPHFGEHPAVGARLPITARLSVSSAEQSDRRCYQDISASTFYCFCACFTLRNTP